ncbi:host attachment protein [Thiomicrorhabdus sp. Kp2]|uniref:host attachment protein n=1 Tax=Thiomicrorhabdus sp. Kp2 TaxID=1123518 RepID=UPI00042850F0|nr:host attachment protein [Thiomicrorhabdus sp. Kp2]
MSTIGYAILVDLGNIKVFAVNKSEQNSTSLQAYQSTENTEVRTKISELYSDKAGDYSNSVTGANSSYENKSDLEIKHRSIELISGFINEFADKHEEKIYLAISDPIHSKVETKLTATTKSKISKSLAKNLTQQNVDNVIKAFEF